ncbi:RNA recognition motif domain-containing protein [Phthorimaea operculella]|nr:RNA recognition motif domain-containing protein [Phthorimaea operculella]
MSELDLSSQRQSENAENMMPSDENTQPIVQSEEHSDQHPSEDVQAIVLAEDNSTEGNTLETAQTNAKNQPKKDEKRQDTDTVKKDVENEKIIRSEVVQKQSAKGENNEEAVSESMTQCAVKKVAESKNNTLAEVNDIDINNDKSLQDNLETSAISTEQNESEITSVYLNEFYFKPLTKENKRKQLTVIRKHLYPLLGISQFTPMRQAREFLRKNNYQGKNLWLKYGKPYSRQANHFKVLHISNLPCPFKFYHVRGMLMLMTNLNVDKGEYMILRIENDSADTKSTCDYLIRFAKSSDCFNVFKNLHGHTFGHQFKSRVIVKVDIDHKLLEELLKKSPLAKKKHDMFMELCKRNAKDVHDAESEFEDSIEYSDYDFEKNETEDLDNETNAIEKNKETNTSNTEGSQDKNLKVLLFHNLLPTSFRVMKTLIGKILGQEFKVKFFRNTNQEITEKTTYREYFVEFNSHEDAVQVRNRINNTILDDNRIKIDLIDVNSLPSRPEKRKWNDNGGGLPNKPDKRKSNASDLESQPAEKIRKTNDGGETSSSSVEMQQQVSQRLFVPLPQWSIGKFGLNKAFLNNLGLDENLPVGPVVMVKNLHPLVDENKLREVFSMAGEIKQIAYMSGNKSCAHIEFDHALEAVQAISMFNKRRLFDQVMCVTMVLEKKTVLPVGLESIGPGLDGGGFALRGIRDHVRLTTLQETLSHAGLFTKQLNNANHPFKFSYVSRLKPRFDNSEIPNSSKIPVWDTNSTKPTDSIAIQAMGAILVSQGLIPADTDLKDFQNIIKALQKNTSNHNVPNLPNVPGSQMPNFQNQNANFNAWQTNLNMPPETTNMPPNMPNQGDPMNQMMSQLMQYLSGNMMPNFQMPNPNDMAYQSMMMAQNFGFNFANMNQTAVPSLAQQPAMMFNSNQQSTSIIQNPSISNQQSTSTIVEKPSISYVPPLPKVPPPINTPNLNQNVAQGVGQSAKVTPPAPQLVPPPVPAPLQKNHNKIQFAIPRRDDKNDYEVAIPRRDDKKDYEDTSSRHSKSKSSTMLLFKNLPPSVSSDALASKMREVGETMFSELTGEGKAVVRFRHTKDAERCLRLFHHSKVDGKVISVTLIS